MSAPRKLKRPFSLERTVNDRFHPFHPRRKLHSKFRRMVTNISLMKNQRDGADTTGYCLNQCLEITKKILFQGLISLHQLTNEQTIRSLDHQRNTRNFTLNCSSPWSNPMPNIIHKRFEMYKIKVKTDKSKTSCIGAKDSMDQTFNRSLQADSFNFCRILTYSKQINSC